MLPSCASRREPEGEVKVELLEWIEVHGYVVDGPYRDIYHQVDQENNDAGSVTEIQFPIRKKS